jgi:hypothetical protein
VSTSDIWHALAGLAGIILSLVIAISAWVVKSTGAIIIDTLRQITARVDGHAERIAKLEGRLGMGGEG